MTTASLTRHQKIVACYGIMRVQIRTQMTYRGNYVFGLIGLLMQVFLLRVLWGAVFPRSGVVHAAGGIHVSLKTQIAYSAIASLQFWLFNPWNFSLIPDRIREGTVAVDLVRPLRFPVQMLAAQVGVTTAMLPFGVIVLPFMVLVGGAGLPASPLNGALYVLSLVPAYLITVILGGIVGMTTFWTLEVSGVFVIYRMVNQFCAGGLVPLWLMPPWLRTVTRCLPFQDTTYTPVGIYLGRLGDTRADLVALGTQWAWVAVLVLVFGLVWSRALRKVVVQGG